MSAQTQSKLLLTVGLVGMLAVLGYYALNIPDQRSTGERIGDAVDAMPQGIDKAADQMKDQTPAEKLGNAIKDRN